MKQVIVLVAMIIVGLVLFAGVSGMGASLYGTDGAINSANDVIGDRTSAGAFTID